MRFPTHVAFLFLLLFITACSSDTPPGLGRLVLSVSPVGAKVELELSKSGDADAISPSSVRIESEHSLISYDLEPDTYTATFRAEGYDPQTIMKRVIAGNTTEAEVHLQASPDTEPVASLTVNREYGHAPLEVSVDASSSKDAEGEITSYLWDFGDGAKASGRNAEHIYTEPGEYVLSLVVADSSGNEATAATMITVDPLPRAEFTATPTNGDNPLVVKLDASLSSTLSTPVHYRWNFGDGEMGEGVLSQHTYSEAGVYTLSLDVTYEHGLELTTSQQIHVNAPPEAHFEATPTEGKAPLLVSFDAKQSSDPDGSIEAYRWDFGDGSLGEGVQVNHSYTSAGAFEVVLSVTDNSNSVKHISDFIYIDVVPPQAAFTYSPASGTAPLEVGFDASESLAGSNDIVEYHWDFGDGSLSEGKTVRHSFAEHGSYAVKLTVIDSEGIPARSTQLIHINGTPTARFDTSTLSGVAPLTVAFDATPSTDPENRLIRYDWTFGDGTTAMGQHAEHVYNKVGTWQAQLTVTDDYGAKHSRSVTIAVRNAAPKANFSLSQDTGLPPLDVTADASASSDPNDTIEHYVWDFGDGTRKTGRSAVHRYTSVGSFELNLTVTDAFGASSSSSRTVTVLNPPPSAAFSLSETTGKAPLEVHFDASESFDDDPDLMYHWRFGNGEETTGRQVSHSFLTEGIHSVTLTITDADGATDNVKKTVTVTPSYPLEPLSVDARGRGFLRGDAPFFWLADTAWLLWTSTEQSDVIRYLDDAKAKGFNVIQVFMSAVWSGNGDNGENRFGAVPYIDNDPTRLNPAYFDYVEWVIDEAAKRDLYIAVAIGEPGRTGDARVPYRLWSDSQAYAYGHALGFRLRKQTWLNNIVWMGGQDYDGSIDMGPSLWSAIAEGVTDGVDETFAFDGKANYEATFMAFHPNGSGSSSRWFQDAAWLDFNGLNNWKRYWNIVSDVATDKQLTLQKPTACVEQSYEFHNYNGEMRTDWHVRFQGYWCALSGTAGYAYGHLPGYRLAMHEGWFESLQSPGRLDMIHLKNILGARSLEKRIPDQSLILSDDGIASLDKTYIAAARADDGSYAFVYSTQGLDFDLDLSILAGTHISAQWFDPREGTYSPLGTFDKGSSVTFDPPGEPGEGNDWLLVLDARD